MAKTIGNVRELKDDGGPDVELQAVATVYNALKPLDAQAQERVLDYVLRRLSLKAPSGGTFYRKDERTEDYSSADVLHSQPESEQAKNDAAVEHQQDEGLEGISPVAQKWMRRNGLSESQLSSLFSLGVDEIDLIAKAVPGNKKKDKMRSVLLLEGVASYLGTGAARVDYEKLKQAVGHYGADPGGNFWSYMKDFNAEVSGSTSSGFTLTSRGLTAATELVKEMAASNKK